MRLAIDTNRYGDFVRGDEIAVQVVQSAEQVFIPFIVLAELRCGFMGGSRGHQNEATLARVLHSAGVAVLYPDDSTTRHYSVLFHQLRRQGTPVPSNDLWIAALAVQNDLVLFSRDGHFDNLPQIPRV